MPGPAGPAPAARRSRIRGRRSTPAARPRRPRPASVSISAAAVAPAAPVTVPAAGMPGPDSRCQFSGGVTPGHALKLPGSASLSCDPASLSLAGSVVPASPRRGRPASPGRGRAGGAGPARRGQPEPPADAVSGRSPAPGPPGGRLSSPPAHWHPAAAAGCQ